MSMVTDIDLSALDQDELSQLIDEAKTMKTTKREEAKARVAELKEELAGLKQRRTKRSAEAEPAPRKSKKGKKRRAE
jgi:flagellar motor switch protein FliG